MTDKKKSIKEFCPDIKRIYIEGSTPDIKIPFNKITLSNKEEVLVSTVEGESAGDKCSAQDLSSDKSVDNISTLPKIRAPWINKASTKNKTQLECAREGIITEEMEYVSIRESFEYSDTMPFNAKKVLDEVARGRAVIPANKNHQELEPMIIGKAFSVKVNANIGASSVSSDFNLEISKLRLALKHGADTVMDLSTGIDDIATLRECIIRNSPVPIGTVPIYEALDRAGGDPGRINWDLFRDVIVDQAKQGVDYFTIHAGLLKGLLPYAAQRMMGIVSRGGSIMASCMMRSGKENLAYEHFDEILDICRQYDVALSLGDGLRPGATADACDKAQYGELEAIGVLQKQCFKKGVQCFIEGPGHVPLNRVFENQDLEDELCNEAPFYTLGPLVTDIAPGYDHITSAIGGTNIAWRGCAMLCYVTPSEHLALPTAKDVKDGLITYKIAAHAADLAKGLPKANLRDDALSRARADFRWYDQFALSLDPQHAYQVFREQMPDDCAHEPSFCSMCGPRFCPIRLNKKLKAQFNVK